MRCGAIWNVQSIAIDDQGHDAMWFILGRPIARLNRDRRSLLKAWGYVARSDSSEIILISAVDQEEL